METSLRQVQKDDKLHWSELHKRKPRTVRHVAAVIHFFNQNDSSETFSDSSVNNLIIVVMQLGGTTVPTILKPSVRKRTTCNQHSQQLISNPIVSFIELIIVRTTLF